MSSIGDDHKGNEASEHGETGEGMGFSLSKVKSSGTTSDPSTAGAQSTPAPVLPPIKVVKKKGNRRKGSMSMFLPPKGFKMDYSKPAPVPSLDSTPFQPPPPPPPLPPPNLSITESQMDSHGRLLVDFPGSDDEISVAEYDVNPSGLVRTNSGQISSANTTPRSSLPGTREKSQDHLEAKMKTSEISQPKIEKRTGGDSHIAELLRKELEKRTENTATSYESDDDKFFISDVTYGGRSRAAPTGMGGGPAPNRPLVGGFAAAAYEASRAHYMQNQGKATTARRSKGYTPPSI